MRTIRNWIANRFLSFNTFCYHLWLRIKFSSAQEIKKELTPEEKLKELLEEYHIVRQKIADRESMTYMLKEHLKELIKEIEPLEIKYGNSLVFEDKIEILMHNVKTFHREIAQEAIKY